SVSDKLPLTLTFVSATPSSGSYNPSNGAWSIGTLLDGDAATLTIHANVGVALPGSSILNCATLSSADSATGNNQTCVCTLVDTTIPAQCNNTPPLLSVPLLQNVEIGETLRFRVAAL